MKVFWSWQSDIDASTNRRLIHDAIELALSKVSSDLALEEAERPSIDHDTKGVAGAVEIAHTIFSKIEAASAFVADVTPITRKDKKHIPNPNVLIELGYALGTCGASNVILVLNVAYGASPDDLPFDLRGRRCMTYDCPPEATKKDREAITKKLGSDLAEALKVNLPATKSVQFAFENIRAKSDVDGSIWLDDRAGIRCHGAFVSEQKQEYGIASGARSFVRIIPTGWTKKALPIADYRSLPLDRRIVAPNAGASVGSWGATSDGFLDFYFASQNDTQRAVSIGKYFEDTGECWTLVVHGWWSNEKVLATNPVLRHWANSIERILQFLDAHGANQHRQIEVGLARADDFRTAGRFSDERHPFRRGNMICTEERAIWTSDARIEFLIEAYTRLKSLVSLPAATSSELLQILNPEPKHPPPPRGRFPG